METAVETEHNNGNLTISQPSTPLFRWIGEQVTILAEAFGEPMTPQRLKVYAGDLSDLDRRQLEQAFIRGRRELKFFPKIAELRSLAGKSQEQQQDAEARKAWDATMKFMEKYVSNDVYGNFGPEHGWYPRRYPTLSERILATVRRTGGWKIYKCMSNDDFPFVQKRFFEEYTAWAAVEQIEEPKLLREIPQLQLDKKTLRVRDLSVLKEGNVERPAFKAKPIPTPMTDTQIGDRREMLRQQADSLAKGKLNITTK